MLIATTSSLMRQHACTADWVRYEQFQSGHREGDLQGALRIISDRLLLRLAYCGCCWNALQTRDTNLRLPGIRRGCNSLQSHNRRTVSRISDFGVGFSRYGSFQRSVDLTGDWRRVYFSELAKALRQRNILSKEEWKFVTRIREDGNYSAHLGSLQREREVKLFQEMAQIQTEHKRQGISIEDTAMAFKGLADKHRVAMSKPRALQNLRDTALVYSRIVNSIRIPEAKAVMTGAIGLEDPLT